MEGNQERSLELQVDRQPQVTLVRCQGSIVIETWAELATTLRHLIPEGKPIRVDLSEVEMLDSVGIGSLVSVWASAKKTGCDLKYRNPSKRVQDVIEITRLHEHLFESPSAGQS